MLKLIALSDTAALTGLGFLTGSGFPVVSQFVSNFVTADFACKRFCACGGFVRVQDRFFLIATAPGAVSCLNTVRCIGRWTILIFINMLELFAFRSSATLTGLRCVTGCGSPVMPQCTTAGHTANLTGFRSGAGSGFITVNDFGNTVTAKGADLDTFTVLCITGGSVFRFDHIMRKLAAFSDTAALTGLGCVTGGSFPIMTKWVTGGGRAAGALLGGGTGGGNRVIVPQ